MEVHPPHEPVHSWRDALIHIGLMTVGLFIALMLEGLVEYVHHKELVHQSRENIRRELEANHQNAQNDIKSLRQSGDKLKDGLKTLRYMQAHRDAKNQSIGFSLTFSDLSDSAWRTARDTGALGFMPLDEVQRYASLYSMQQTITDEAMRLLTQQAETLAPIMAEDEDFAKMTDQEFSSMRLGGAKDFADVYVLQQLVRDLDEEYVLALKRR